MVFAQRRNANFIKALFLWIFFAMEISGGSAQLGQLNIDGETYSTSSKVTGNFAMTLDSRFIYRLTWRFNESQICTAAVNPGMSLVPYSLMCDSSSHAIGSDEWYYADNSQISGTISSGVLRLDLVYAKALFQEYALFMDVFDNAAVQIVSNVVNISVQNCTEKTGGISQSSNFGQPSVSCDYLCSTSLVCAEGYSDSSGKNNLNATCQANNTWEENGNPCEPIPPPPCNITKCIGCCNQTSISDALQYGEELNVSCCNNISDSYQYICLNGSTSPSITCPDIPSTSIPVTTAMQSSAGNSAEVTNSYNTGVCIGGCKVISYSNVDFELTCLDQSYNKKSLPATKNPDRVFTADFALYCIGYTAGYIAGFVISVIGGLAIVTNFVLVAFARNTSSADGKNINLLGLGIISTVVWSVSIGLLFGLEKGDYDMNGGQIAGCVIGSIACVGTIVSCAWSGMVMKQSKRDVPKEGGQHMSNPHADESVNEDDRGNSGAVYHPVVGESMKSRATNL